MNCNEKKIVRRFLLLYLNEKGIVEMIVRSSFDKFSLVKMDTIYNDHRTRNMLFSPCGRFVVVSLSGNKIGVIDEDKNSKVIEQYRDKTPLRDNIIMNPIIAIGTNVVAGDEGDVVNLWTYAGKYIYSLVCGCVIRSLAISPNDIYLAVGLANGNIMIWDLYKENLYFTQFISRSLSDSRTGNNVATSLRFSKTGRFLVLGTSYGTVSIWDVESKKILLRWETERGYVERVCISDDENFIAVKYYENDRDIIKIWNLQGESINEIKKLRMGYFRGCLRISPCNRFILLVDSTGYLFTP